MIKPSSAPFTLVLLLLAAQTVWSADLILHNGKVVTVDAGFSTAEAVAITGNRITAVGSSRDVLAAHRTAGVKLIDLSGRTVLPGLIDSHVHPLGAGLSELRGKLPPLDSFAAVQAFLRDKASTTPAGQWIVVPRTFPTRLKEMRMPTREVLDVVDTHPVMFDASYVWIVNSRGLRESGITRDTPNPAGGEIVRDAKGEPNGILRNAGRLLKGLNRAENFTHAEKLLALEQMLGRYVDAGLTTISDRAVTAEDIELYDTLLAQGKLPLRAVLTWRLDASGPVDDVVARLKSAPYRAGKGVDPAWLKFGAFKVTLDGGMTIGTAYQRIPYGEFGKQLYGMTNPDFRGQIFLSPAKLFAIMETARGLGWPLTAHAQGGGAIDALLDCFEALNKTRPIAPTRSHLMHASFQSPEAIDRLAKLGLPADVQPAWLYKDGPALSKVFPNGGMRYFFPLRTYRSKGVVLAGGSDHMIGHDRNSATNPYNPFLGIWTAVTRKMTNGAVLHAEERISRADAIRMYTLWGAYMQHAETERGSIEKGKLADLVVLDRDILTVAEDEIRNLQPVTVILDGRIVRGGSAAKAAGWNEVQPILQARCVGCHQKGEIAPMAFTTYQEVRPWAKAIRTAVASRTMPPWHAVAGSHRFRNDRSLSAAESAALVGWADAGAPGPAGEAATPATVVQRSDWKLGQPDRVVQVPGYQVSSSGQLPYTFLIVPLRFEKDTWIRAAEFKIDQRATVHHMNAFIRPPNSSYLAGFPVGELFVPTVAERGKRRDGERVFERRQLLLGYEPGYEPMPWLENGAKLIPAGSDLVLEMHFNPNGKPAVDHSEVALYFARQTPERRVIAIDTLRDLDLQIPPHEAKYVSTAAMTLARPAELLSVQPHMHVRGASMEVTATLPGGKLMELIRVPKYDFNWQTTYVYRDPIPLPAGTRLESVAGFNNSVNNRHNPNPEATVRWGDQTTEEMHIAFLELVLEAKADPDTLFQAQPKMVGAPPR